MIPQDFIQTLLGRVDIVEVIDRHVRLKKAGANYKACCPFHNEKTPSFNVSPTKQFYHCFGCGAHGNAIGFVMEYSGLAYPDAIRELAQQVGMEVPEVRSAIPGRPAPAQAKSLVDRMMEALNYYRNELKKTPEAIEYLKRRGLSGEIAARYGLGYAPDAWQSLKAVFADYEAADLKDTGLVIDSEPGEGAEGEPAKKSRRYDRFRGRVMFPILDSRGNVIGFGGRIMGDGEPKYLNSPETPLFEKGRELYGLWQARRAIRDANLVIVVEGYMDVVALAQHGIENAVATLGTATTPAHVMKLLRLADSVVFCFDGDSAGRKAAWKALEVSLPVLADGKSVAFLFLPAEDDPDTYVRRLGKEAFMKALAEARPLSQFLLAELAANTDMGSEEGRARFLARARPLVTQIEAPALGAMIRKRLAAMAGLDPGELPGYLPSPGAGARPPRPPRPGRAARAYPRGADPAAGAAPARSRQNRRSRPRFGGGGGRQGAPRHRGLRPRRGCRTHPRPARGPFRRFRAPAGHRVGTHRGQRPGRSHRGRSRPGRGAGRAAGQAGDAAFRAPQGGTGDARACRRAGGCRARRAGQAQRPAGHCEGCEPRPRNPA